jgi:hypothetical protein
VRGGLNMLSEYAISSSMILLSYILFRRYNVRNVVPYPVIGAIYAVDKPIFSVMFLFCFLISSIFGEFLFRRFLIYGMRVFHAQLFISITSMLPYSLASSDHLSLVLAMLSGQMAYDTHSSRDQIKTASLFSAVFLLSYAIYHIVRWLS